MTAFKAVTSSRVDTAAMEYARIVNGIPYRIDN